MASTLHCIWPLVVILGLTALWIDQSEASGGRCSSYPELYYANVAGNIKGGANTIKVGDQTRVFGCKGRRLPKGLCSKRSFVDLRYRQMDGRCNHRLDYGSAHQPVKRYQPPAYSDIYRANTPRLYSFDSTRTQKYYLPSPRAISWKICPDEDKKDQLTMLVLQVGQLLDHDCTSAPVPTETNSSIKCCGLPYKDVPHECFPIPVLKDDPHFQSNCMEFVRSDAAMDEDGKQIYPRIQLNALTSFVDGSCFYGNDDETLALLRSKDGTGALLKTHYVNGRERLPENPESECLDDESNPDSYCQLAGDKRVNEQPGLAAIHTIFHLEHNRIVRLLAAAILKKRGRPVTDRIVERYIEHSPAYVQEKLFQESKKILSGIWQKIVYCDWLPIILGPRLINKFKLGCSRRSRYNRYVDPRIANAFLTAAFRFGHSLIPNKLNINYQRKDLKDNFMIPDENLQHFESIMEGLCQKGSQEPFDRFISNSVSRHLFETKFMKNPLDLVALNVQRGRDHGIRPYYTWRYYYGLRPIRSFNFFPKMGSALKKVYRNYKDIDLFIGGILEDPVYGGVVGDTFGHIIAHQFADLKYGDAHFFLSKQVPQGFTSEQLDAILAVDIKSILCAHTYMDKVQKNPFWEESPSNPYVDCNDVADIDLSPWLIYW